MYSVTTILPIFCSPFVVLAVTLGAVADVDGRRESADVADAVVAGADEVEIRIEQLLVLDAPDDAEHTPR